MGTRGLTMVVSGGKKRVAQYGQWDHYPSGQGMTALHFLKETNFEEFAKKLTVCKFVDEEKQKEVDTFLESIGSKDGWMNGEQANKYKEKYPYITRDHGAGVLELIRDSEDEEIWLNDSEDFIEDGLFCEWGYVIDLDKRTFEVFSGYAELPNVESDRFKKGITCVKIYSLDDLPTEEQFIEDLTEKVEEE